MRGSTGAVVGGHEGLGQTTLFDNGVVHQIAPGEVHVALWNLILDALKDPNSIYKCYAGYFVDER